jgi:hypothetical protein
LKTWVEDYCVESSSKKNKEKSLYQKDFFLFWGKKRKNTQFLRKIKEVMNKNKLIQTIIKKKSLTNQFCASLQLTS